MLGTEPIKLLRVREGLKTKILGCSILWFRRLTSTNYLAKELALKGAREGTVIVAETQTSGRGRLKRKWRSPEGGLWISIILRPKAEPKHTPKLTLMASVAVVKTITQLFSLKAEIKWPNDVLINQKKVCGILTEATTKGNAVQFTILGIGINANFSLSSFPIGLRDSTTTLQEELKKEIELEALLLTLLEEIELYYGLFTKEKFDVILKEWRNQASFLGSYVEVASDNEKFKGWAADIDNDGALIVKLRDQTVRKVTSGDIAKIKKLNTTK